MNAWPRLGSTRPAAFRSTASLAVIAIRRLGARAEGILSQEDDSEVEWIFRRYGS